MSRFHPLSSTVKQIASLPFYWIDLMDANEAIALLQPYSSCDISDALHRLPSSDFGQLTDIHLISPSPLTHPDTRICGPAFTVEFVKSHAITTSTTSKLHHMDRVPENSVVVIKAPSGPNAVFGGLMAARAMALGVKAVVVHGRVRDRKELAEYGSSLPVFANGFSTLGASPFMKVGSSDHIGDGVGGSVTVPGYDSSDIGYPAVVVATGDLIVADIDGVVRVPICHVMQIAQICKQLVTADAHCMDDIKTGRSLTDAFAEHRKRPLQQ
ncbi:hypothetical protein BDEG_23503 [Batrachochytrium dendrobatidis JEL423]|uniref:RraA-like protein n=1 Tax=Batrachochytrium dendrobatidis (strain JEL423) TaxID=403673 RepID=A0A177WHY3_BATDL|nr:hypothetical protein BDEG_23503 [Batrachochytrium dendrobatidis JEL423]